MTSKVRSFRGEMVFIILLSILFTILTEGVIIGSSCLIFSMTGQSVSEPLMENGSDRPPSYMSGFLYRQKGMEGDGPELPTASLTSLFWILLVIAVVGGIILFLFYFLLLTKKFSTYIKEISSGIQEIAIGNFENKIPIKDKNELSMIAESINTMSNNIYLLLCDEKQNEDVKNELITSVAHDLRTPLTSIIGYLYLVLYKDNIGMDKKEHYVQIAYDKAKRLEQLIEDLFRYTKYSTDEVKLHNEKIDFVRFMGQMVEEFYPSFKDAELNYEFHSDLQEAYVMADGNLLARAIGNLVSNAIKYGKDGKYIKITVTGDENWVSVAVLNYGAVIPKDALVHIFERFYRVENSRSEETGGSGLGLAIAKQIILMHDGMIEARSDYNGTVFEVKLKRYNEQEEASHEMEEQN